MMGRQFLFALAVLVPCASAFQTPGATVRTKSVAVNVGDLFDKYDSFKEARRASRRTVYGPNDWRKHRSTKRYFRSIFTAIQSMVFRGLALELLLVAGLATGIVAIHTAGIASLAMSPMPLTLTAPALGLLITYRTNQAYGRWWEARKIWGAVINKTRDLTRQSHWFKDTERAKRFSALAVAFGYALNAHCLQGTLTNPKKHIGDFDSVDAKLENELSSLIGDDATAEVLAGPHRPVEVCRLLTKCVAEEGLTPQLEARVDETIAFFSDFGGMCDRLQKTPMPLVYTRHTARFLMCWLCFVPSALLTTALTPAAVVVSTLAVSTLMLGIDELGVQIEEPFSILPMDSYNGGLRALHEYAEFKPSPSPKRPIPVYV